MTYDDIQAWVGISGVIAAVVAMYISIKTEMRSQSRWRVDKDLAMDIAAASARPLLSISRLGYENRVGLRLANDGVGSAIITEVTIGNGNRTSNSVAELVDVGQPVVWDTFRRFKPPFQPIGAGQTRMLIELTESGLKNNESQGHVITDSEIREIMRRLKHELGSIKIQIAYTDIFGTKQSLCTWNAEADGIEK